MRPKARQFLATVALLFTAVALALAFAMPRSGLTAASIPSNPADNNMWNFQKSVFNQGHSGQDQHQGWTNLGGWDCDGNLHSELLDGLVPDDEHNCSTSIHN